MELGTDASHPIHMKLISDVKLSRLILVGALTIAPVAVAILMQNPALRQQLQMRFWRSLGLGMAHTGSVFADAAEKCRMKYDLARM